MYIGLLLVFQYNFKLSNSQNQLPALTIILYLVHYNCMHVNINPG